MEKYIAIACGGALGALARTVVGEWVMARLGPKISATVYVLGSQNLYPANVDGHFTTTIGRCRGH